MHRKRVTKEKEDSCMSKEIWITKSQLRPAHLLLAFSQTNVSCRLLRVNANVLVVCARVSACVSSCVRAEMRMCVRVCEHVCVCVCVRIVSPVQAHLQLL